MARSQLLVSPMHGPVLPKLAGHSMHALMGVSYGGGVAGGWLGRGWCSWGLWGVQVGKERLG